MLISSSGFFGIMWALGLMKLGSSSSSRSTLIDLLVCGFFFSVYDFVDCFFRDFDCFNFNFVFDADFKSVSILKSRFLVSSLTDFLLVLSEAYDCCSLKSLIFSPGFSEV